MRPRFRFRRHLASALVAILLVLPLAGSARQGRPDPPTPLMWKSTVGKSTVYLLGSFHLLKPEDRALSAEVEAALADAEKLMFEVTPEELDDPRLASRVIAYAGFGDARTLSEVLPETTRAGLERELEQQGARLEQFEGFEPWFVNLTLVTALSQRLGYRSEHGLDRALMRRAAEAGKPVQGLETLDAQLRSLDSAPLDEQVASLADFVARPERMPGLLDELYAAWRRGDASAMDRLAREEMQRRTPQTYRRLNVERNEAWLPQIRARLPADRDEDTLVVVGALHLLGPDGLVERLRALGHRVERVEPAAAGSDEPPG